jgi:signal transduction histidine kinase
MRRRRKLSLRARMLIVLVGVTTVLLLIMGIVSTYLLGNRVNSQVAATDKRLSALAAALVSDPQAAAQEKVTDYAVVEVRVRAQLTVVPLTSGSLTTQLASATAQQLKSPAFTPVASLAQQGRLGRARLLLASLNCGTFPSLGCKPFEIVPGLETASRWVPAELTAAGGVSPYRGAILLVAEPVDSSRSQVSGFILAELVTGAALIILVALGGEWLIGRGLAPLDTMTRTANDITDRGDLTERMPDADHQTEVGRLGSSINTMLDRIQQAFSSRLRSEQKVREFAADASHELRTPLTTIRGYAELYRQGALGPDQLPSAMRRIEQEAERMSILVAELLELARLDRTTSLDLTETDLAGVVADAAADATAVEPQRPVRAEAPDRLVAVVDEARIRQVLANLLGNVRAHTPPGTPAVVRLGAVSGGVLLEVADAGPGMPAEDAARAFDRFHRAGDRASPGDATAAPGRGDRTSGSGLGLSIVQAIAMAHGGRATLESAPGQGTVVRVWLPVRTVP